MEKTKSRPQVTTSEVSLLKRRVKGDLTNLVVPTLFSYRLEFKNKEFYTSSNTIKKFINLLKTRDKFANEYYTRGKTKDSIIVPIKTYLNSEDIQIFINYFIDSYESLSINFVKVTRL